MSRISSFLKRAFTTELWITVLVAIVLGAALGLVAPEFGASLLPLGDGFIALLRMLIAPVIFCTIVTGIASAGELTGVGRVGVKALVYFEVITTIALIMGLVVMNVFSPGASVNANPADIKITGDASTYVSQGESQHWYDFLIDIVPSTVVGAFVDDNVLQVLLVAILFAVAVRLMGERGAPIVRGAELVGEAVFGIVRMVMYLAPIGAFGAMAYATGEFGVSTLTSLGSFVALFLAGL